MVGFGEDPGDRPSDDDTDRSDRGTGRSGTSPSGPPEDDNDDVNPGGRFGGPPEDDNDDDVFTPPDRGGPPEDSGEEGDRVDDVTPSPDPGLPPEDDNRDQFGPKPDRRGPSERQLQEEFADLVDGVEEDDIDDVRRVETDDGRGRLEADLDTPTPQERFEQRRERARREADVDAVSRLGAFDTSELSFRREEGSNRVSIQPTDTAQQRRRQELSDQRVTAESPDAPIQLDRGFADQPRSEQREELADQIEGVEADDIQDIQQTEDGIEVDIQQSQRDILFDTLGVDPDRQPSSAAKTAGSITQTARDENLIAPADVALSVAAESARDGRLAEQTEAGVEFFEPTATAVENAIDQAEQTANDTPIGSSALVPNSVDREVGETFVGETAVGATAFTARAFNPGRIAQDIVQAPSRTFRAADAATNENAPSNLQTAADVTEEGAEFAAEEGPEFARENPQRAAEVGLGTAGVLGASVVAPTAGIRGARRVSDRLSTAARRSDTDFISDERATGQIPRGRSSEPDKITSDDIVERPDGPDQTSVRPELERGDDIDPADPVQRRRDRRVEEGADDRGRDEAFRRTLERRQRAREQPDADLREAADVEPESATSADQSTRGAVPVSGERRRLEQAQQRSVTPADPLDQSPRQDPIGEELNRLSSTQTLGVEGGTTDVRSDERPDSPEQRSDGIVEPEQTTAADIFDSSFSGSDIEPAGRTSDRQSPGTAERLTPAARVAQAADEATAQQFEQFSQFETRSIGRETETNPRTMNREIETETRIPGRRIPIPKNVRFPELEDEDDEDEEVAFGFFGVQDIEAQLDPTDEIEFE